MKSGTKLIPGAQYFLLAYHHGELLAGKKSALYNQDCFWELGTTDWNIVRTGPEGLSCIDNLNLVSNPESSMTHLKTASMNGFAL